MRTLPPLNALVAFEAVARNQSVAKAGSELGISQSAVSHRLRLLEDYLAEPLFEKVGRQLQLSDTGRGYFVEVERILNELSHLTRQVKGEGIDQLRLTSYSSFALKRLVPLLPSFRARHPDIDLRLQMVTEEPLLSSKTGDLFICFTATAPGYVSRLLHKERLVAVCSPSLYQEIDHQNWRQDLLNFPLLSCDLDEDAKQPGGDWAVWSKGLGIALPVNQGFHSFSHQVLALEAAETGQGIALVSDFMVEKDIREGKLVDLPVSSVYTGYDFYLCFKQARSREQGLRAVVDWLVETAASPLDR
ncbi:LysR substrate-binding domain-containing protein [Agarivorans sp. Toyoura001]|uniref:LysR substrate-binding domain-containing protein n=1 Tax=unclassified Agarivorans TaxID=2636026 RepID=UPI0010D50635|nr:LysR substrate-binding domain-containing protein [Agarivorans sp. Toyoura001]GDY25435.1 LysR family transcriptional regulator [Agarivorans sp. Toyoura001]